MLLKELTRARGVSGNENEIRALLTRLAQERGAACRVDRIGNLIADTDGGDGSLPHILLDAHMDEVGLLVTGVRDDGLLRYRPVGGIDSRVLVSKRVLLGDANVPGVIGAKAIHLQTPADRDRVLGHEGLFIDIGAKTKAEAEKLCPPGTYAVFDSPLETYGEGMVCGKNLDDRAGCLTLLKALEHGYGGRLTCAFTAQEEVGVRGATVLGQTLDYDLAIVMECTSANDLGDVPVYLQVANVGQGVAISVMDNASIGHPGLVAAMFAIAKEKGIACQPKRFVSGGNNTGAWQRGRHARPAVVLSIPTRYIHSPMSAAARSDIDAQAALALACLDSLPARWDAIANDNGRKER